MVGVKWFCLSRCLIRACYRRSFTEMLPACVIARTEQRQSTAQNQILRGDLAPAALKGPQHLVADVSVFVIAEPSEKVGGGSIGLGFEPAWSASTSSASRRQLLLPNEVLKGRQARSLWGRSLLGTDDRVLVDGSTLRPRGPGARLRSGRAQGARGGEVMPSFTSKLSREHRSSCGSSAHQIRGSRSGAPACRSPRLWSSDC
jgi:hypothetical protein